MLPQYGIWLGVSADSLREASHPTEYEARTILGGEEGGRRRFGLVLSWSWGAGVPGGTWRRTKVASVMALGSRSPWGYLGKNKNSFRHGPGESESPGILEE